MSRGTSVLPARSGWTAETTTKGTAAAPRGQRPPRRRRGWARRLLGGLRDSCVFAAAALLGCLALVAIGALGSLVWAYVVER